MTCLCKHLSRCEPGPTAVVVVTARLLEVLCLRVRREHMAMSIKVQEGREMQENYLEDETVLTSYMHDMRAAREDADRELAHMRKMAEDAHKDWMRKLKDRRKEVR